MTITNRTVLITGCSEGGLGDGLARAFHKNGDRVIATARNPAKMAHLKDLGIETLVLDVVSKESIAACVTATAEKTGGTLDMLVNNSGGGYCMPLVDADLDEARRLFDVNVWAVLAVTQAFMPLLLKSAKEKKQGACIVNQTSIASVVPAPVQGIYNASKAAAALMTDTLRLELAPFNIKVVDLKTGSVASQFFANQLGGGHPTLPANSIYLPAKDTVEGSMTGRPFMEGKMTTDQWANQVVGSLSSSWWPMPVQVWNGTSSWLVWFCRRFLPFTFMDGSISGFTGMNVVKQKYLQQLHSTS